MGHRRARSLYENFTRKHGSTNVISEVIDKRLDEIVEP